MSVVGYRARNHPQQVTARGPRPDVDDRATTPELFDPLHERFGFTVDVCALPHNAKLPRYFTPDDDGLAQSWAGERVWCNPPYSSIEPWVVKAWDSEADLVVMLLPANRTEQVWWQRHVEPYRDPAAWEPMLRVEFLPGRPRFIAAGADGVGPNERPPFGCCLLVFDRPDSEERP
jgi:phage N-6-adenine-methyltransferase